MKQVGAGRGFEIGDDDLRGGVGRVGSGPTCGRKGGRQRKEKVGRQLQ